MITERETASGPFRDARDVEALARAFEECTVTSEEWTHAAHLVVALWYATRHPVDEATRRMRDGIHRLLDANGVVSTPTSGYHETITVAWVRVVRAFADEREGESLAGLANAVVEYGARDLLERYYRKETLMSTEARARWVEPDLEPLP